MTSPTGPDRDRLRASDAGQDTCPFHVDGLPCPYGHGPAPQQPPAQEREVPCDMPEVCETPGRHTHPMQPSEADSAGEAWRVGRSYGIHVYCGDRPVATFLDAADAERAVADHNAGVRGGDDQARERLANVLAELDVLTGELVPVAFGERYLDTLARIRRAAGGAS